MDEWLRNTQMRTNEEQKQENPKQPETDKPTPETDSEWTPRQEPDSVPAERSDKPEDPSKL